ncbi:tetratricopeptide repeat protein [Streptosporangium amethystogenes]|uniref:tetratricopeptide repeat protein n=1 Tax=Streptosporangium amethystogenes TaxID=2002 RepID=UPI0031D22E7F
MHHDLIQIAHVRGNVTVTQTTSDSGASAREQVVEGDIPAQPVAFQVRTDLLARLHTQVAVGGAAVVCTLTGTPGVGKTLLAASYAWACQAAGWPVVAWIPAETENQILAGLDGLAVRLGMHSVDDDAETTARRVKAWMSGTHQPCLVVFDNATDIPTVRRWCPTTGAARVVITSRNRAFSRHYAPVEVQVFTPAQAAAFLTERTGLTDEDAASELAAELGHLPLALAQAAAMIAWQKISYRAYLRSLRDLPLERHLTALEGDAYPAGAAQAILLSLALAEQATLGARRLLEVLAVLSPAGVARLLLHSAPILEPGDQSEIDELLARLADTSLITFTDDGQAVLMHRLIQRVLRERAYHEARLQQAVDTATGLLATFNAPIPTGAATWGARPSVEALLEHTGTLYAIAHLADLLTPELLDLRGWCGRRLTDLADLPRGIALLQQTLVDSERLLGVDHPATLTSRHDLAYAYGTATRATEAITLLEQVLSLRERVLGTDHPDTLTSRNNLASAYQSAGRIAEAITLFEQMLADSERVLGTDHPRTLTSRNNLAYTHGSAGRTTKAIILLEQVLADNERVLGTDHPNTLANRHNLANAYLSAEQVEKAVILLEQVLADNERVLGTDHPNTLANRHSLASAYQSAGRIAEAITLYEQVLADNERVLGTDHPNTLANRHSLASAYQSAKQIREAITLYQQVVTDRERVLGANHPGTLSSRHNLAYTYRSAGRIAEAITLYEQVLADSERVLGADHPNTLTNRHNLAGAYGLAGRVTEGLALYKQVLADSERALGADHPLTRMMRKNLGGTR